MGQRMEVWSTGWQINWFWGEEIPSQKSASKNSKSIFDPTFCRDLTFFLEHAWNVVFSSENPNVSLQQDPCSSWFGENPFLPWQQGYRGSILQFINHEILRVLGSVSVWPLRINRSNRSNVQQPRTARSALELDERIYFVHDLHYFSTQQVKEITRLIQLVELCGVVRPRSWTLTPRLERVRLGCTRGTPSWGTLKKTTRQEKPSQRMESGSQGIWV